MGVATDDREAAIRVRAGDVGAFEVLVTRYGELAYRAAVLWGAGNDADDVVQDSFVKAFGAMNRFRGDAPFRPWLLQIVANETKNLHRSRQRRDRAVQQLASVTPADAHLTQDTPEQVTVAGERNRRLLDAVRGLDEKDRWVVTCRYLLELSELETAQVLGWPLGSVKSRNYRALGKLRALLGQQAAMAAARE